MPQNLKFVQKSFAKGIISESVFLRENIPGYSEAVRDLYNFFVGRSGEIYRRGGTTVIEKRANNIARIIPFSLHDETYLIIFETYPAKPNNFLQSDNGDQVVDYPYIRALRMDDKTLSVRAYADIANQFNSSVPVKIHTTPNAIITETFASYGRDPTLPFAGGELDGMTYCQIGTVMVFINEGFPPFFIRKEGDDFIYYRNILDMQISGDSEVDVVSALSGLPFSFYGYGFIPEFLENTPTDKGSYHFDGSLRLNNNYDRAGLSRKNLGFWKNRAFICSLAKTDSDSVIVYGGIIRQLYISGRNKNRYRITGELFIDDLDDLLNIPESSSTALHICDWTYLTGWPRCVAEFENRFVYAGNTAYPAKLWFSSQPSIQRVPFGNIVTITKSAENTEETRTEKPLFKEVYYGQLDLFNKDQEALGLVAQHTASAGSYFINNARGLSIYWVVKGEVLFIGTNIGVFISRGTDASAPSPVPFNSGFQLVDHIPCKRVFPVLVEKTLYYISRENSVRMLKFGSQGGYEAKDLDTFSRESVRDNSSHTVVPRVITRRNYEATFPTGAAGGPGSFSFDVDLSDDPVRSKYTYNGGVGYSDNEDPLLLLSVENIEEWKTNKKLEFVYQKTSAVEEGQKDSSAEDHDLKNYDIDYFLYSTLIDTTVKYIISNRNALDPDTLRGALLSGTIQISHNFLIRLPFFRDGFEPRFPWVRSSDVKIRGFANNHYDQAQSDYAQSLLLNPGGVSFVAATWAKKVPALNASGAGTYSWIQGKISNGYVLPSRVSFLDPQPDNTYNTRLCGVRRNADGDITLIFDKAGALDASIAKVEILSGTVDAIKNDSGLVSLYKGAIQNSVSWAGGNDRYGTDSRVFQTPPVVLNTKIMDEDTPLLIRFLDDNDAVLNKIAVVLENDGTTEMRDSLFNKYSGQFFVGAHSGYIDRVLSNFNDILIGLPNPLRTNISNNVVYAPLPATEDPRTQPLLKISGSKSYADSVLASYQKTIIDNYVSMLGVDFSEYTLSGARSSGFVSPEDRVIDFTVNETEVIENHSYPIFSPDTRLLYDWVKRVLFISRDQNYVAITLDKAGGVSAWHRGDMDLSDAVYLPNLLFQLPEKHPAVFGISRKRVVMLTEGLNTEKVDYLNGLSNCLDDHICFVPPENKLNLTTLKNNLIALGFNPNENISIETSKKRLILQKKPVGGLGGVLDLETNEDALIVGRPFQSFVIPFAPSNRFKDGSTLRGKKYDIPAITIFLLRGAIKTGSRRRGPDFSINNKSVQLFQPDFNNMFPDSLGIYEYMVKAKKGFDPKFRLEVSNPQPFALAGWVLDIKI